MITCRIRLILKINTKKRMLKKLGGMERKKKQTKVMSKVHLVVSQALGTSIILQ